MDWKRTRESIIAGLFAVAGLGLLSLTSAEEPDVANVSRVLSGRVLHDAAGEPVKLQSLDGHVVVVNFWASWCKPCKREMPLLNDLHRRLSGEGVRVLAISVDREPRRVARFMEDNSLELPVYVDGPEGLAKRLDLEFLPCTIVLDPTGRVVYRGATGEGPAWEELVTLVDRLLAQHEDASGASKVKS